LEELTAYIVGGLSILLVAFFSFADGALSEFSWMRLQKRISDSGRLRRFRSDERCIAISVRIIHIISSVSFGFAVLFTTLGFFPQKGSHAYALAGAIVIAAMLLFGTVPDLLGRRNPESVLHFLLPVLSMVERPTRLITRATISVAEIVARILGFPQDETGPEAIEEEIMSAIAEGKQEGMFTGGEDEMLRNVIEFRELQILEIMTPRTDMFALEADTVLDEAVRLARKEGHSRVPVFGENLDDINGVLYVKDLLEHWDSRENGPMKVSDLARKPHFVPETKSVGDLLVEMKKEKVHIAIVMDEYGGTAGIITIEDIIEEIVGEIEDEFDKKSAAAFQAIDARTAMVDARLHVDDLNANFELSLPEDDSYETVSGYLFAQIGRIPQTGEEIALGDVTFTILDADERSIKRVRVVKTEAADE